MAFRFNDGIMLRVFLEYCFKVPTYRQDIEEYFVTRLLKTPLCPVPVAIFESVSRFPMTYASEASFAFVSAASAFEDPIVQTPTHLIGISGKIYKSAAMFSADIYAAETLFDRRASCHDIVEIWLRTRESYFTPTKPKVIG